jgi:hypothetical protein
MPIGSERLPLSSQFNNGFYLNRQERIKGQQAVATAHFPETAIPGNYSRTVPASVSAMRRIRLIKVLGFFTTHIGRFCFRKSLVSTHDSG